MQESKRLRRWLSGKWLPEKWFGGDRADHDLTAEIARRWREVESLAGAEFETKKARLRESAAEPSVLEAFPLIAEACRRAVGLAPFPTQIQAALALDGGRIAEMQTGEGKTLAAVFPAVRCALGGGAVHVLTVNDYLARRDARWMGPVYRAFGLTVGAVTQGLTREERRAAYSCDVVYATANEIGFDYLRDHLAHEAGQLVQVRDFHFGIIDEADSILIDEARIPLVIAGAAHDLHSLAAVAARAVEQLRRHVDYFTDQYARNVQLTDAGASRVEWLLGCGNLYAPSNMGLLAAVNHALHAEALLRRDVDYLVKGGAIEMVDEFKGRIAENRRWPDGLHAAVEAKERVAQHREGRILASITLQNLVGLYPRLAGMTATAHSQVEEFRDVYGLDVTVIPTQRPMIRKDHPDVVFTHRAAKEALLLEHLEEVHATGRPVLVGTASVEESERLGARLEAHGIPHHVLNARNDEQEAAIIAQAGQRGAVTISTNMAGRGTDILLGEGVAELGGLYVIGTNKHESVRIDNQLRGRAGRQGDPGSSRFFVSLEDDLISRYRVLELLPPEYRSMRKGEPVADPVVHREILRAQRIIEGQNFEIRRMLLQYERVLEGQRLIWHERRRSVLLGTSESLLKAWVPDRAAAVEAEFGAAVLGKVERQIVLAKIDELWSDYLMEVRELREGVHWVSFAGRRPLDEFQHKLVELFEMLEARFREEVTRVFEEAAITAEGIDAGQSGLLDTSATWTYLTNDQPFGDMNQRIARALEKMLGTIRADR